jgi:hypothetical protein
MNCIVCFKELENSDDELCPSCKEFIEEKYLDLEEQELILEWYRQNAKSNLL